MMLRRRIPDTDLNEISCVESYADRQRLRMAASLCSFFVLVSTAGMAFAQPNAETVTALELAPPQSTMEAVANVKKALGVGVFKPTVLIHEKMLLQIFGGKQVTWITNTTANQAGYIPNDKYIDSDDKHDIDIVQFSRASTSDGPRAPYVQFSMTPASGNNASYDSIISLFGPLWKPDLYPNPHLGTVPRATAPHGNFSLNYSTPPNGWLTFKFNPDASLQSLDFSMRQ